jgi:hypothetical protein
MKPVVKTAEQKAIFSSVQREKETEKKLNQENYLAVLLVFSFAWLSVCCSPCGRNLFNRTEANRDPTTQVYSNLVPKLKS